MIQACVFTDEISQDFEEAVRVCTELRVPYVEPRGLWGKNISDAIGSPALTCCWDVANSWHYERIGYPDAYQHVRGLVTHLHIKDAKIDPEDRSRLVAHTHIDRGDIPYHEIFQTLLDDGFDGLASVETHLFFGMADRYAWLKPATIHALRNLNRVLAEVQGHL